MAGAAEGTGGRHWGSWSLMRAGEETPTKVGCERGSCSGRSYKNRAPTGGR